MKKHIKTIFFSALIVLLFLSFPYIEGNSVDVFSYEIIDGGCYIKSCDADITGNLEIPAKIEGVDVVCIDNNTFANCSGISSVIIPDTVEIIGDNAFYNCRNITVLNIPDSVTYIGSSAFYKCTGLVKIDLSQKLTTISDNLFYMCKKLKEIQLPPNVEIINDNAFSGCKSLECIVFPETLTTISDFAFDSCIVLESIYLPSTVEFIGTDAFADCNSMKKVYYSGSSELPEDLCISSGNGVLNSATWIFNHYHTDRTINNTVFPTCTTSGYSEYVCRCGLYEKSDYIDPTGHLLSVFNVSVQPDCKNEGIAKVSCSACDYYEIMTLPAESHRIVVDEAISATCFEDGKTEGSHCLSCGEIMKKQDTVPAMGHDYSEKIYDDAHLVSPATYLKGGIYRYSCSRCSAVSEKTHVGNKLILGKPAQIISGSTENSITIKWSNVKDATGYGLYYYKTAEKKWKLYKTLNSNAFTFSSLPSGSVYSFAVKAYVVENGKTIASPEHQIITESTRPAKPSKIAAAQNEKAVKVSWTAVKGATGYRVYGYNTKTQSWVVVKSSTKSCSNITGNLKSGTYYKFAVRPYTDLGTKVVWCESYAEIITATKPLPPRLKATSLAGAIRFEWDAVSGADGYLIFGSTKPDSGYVQVKATKSLGFTMNGLKRGTTYYFKAYSAKKLYNGYVYSYAGEIKAVKTR